MTGAGGESGLLSNRRFWGVIAVVVGLAAVFAYAAGSAVDAEDPIDRMRREGDVAGLREVAGAEDAKRAAQAVDALAYVGEKAVGAIVEAAGDKRPAVRERAALSLIRVSGREHAPRLAKMVREDKSRHVRATAASALGQVYACQQVPDLLQALEDKDPIVRERAQWAVARICGAEPGYEERDPAKRHRMLVNYYRCYWKIFGKKMTQYHQEYNKR